MLRVLTLSTLFPNAAQPTLGIFVERQTLALAALPDVAVEVVAPIGLPLWPLSRHPHYAARAELPEAEQWKGLAVHRPRYPVLPLIGRGLDAHAMARALLPLLRSIRTRFPFDVIDAEFFWPDGPAAATLAAALDVPFSIKARGSDIDHWGGRRGIGGQIRKAGRAADGLLVVSEALKARMSALGIPAAKIKVHHTGVDHDLFRPRDKAAAKAALGVDGPLIVTVGGLIERKGQRLAIEALARLPDATLVLAGDGPERAALQRAAAQLGVDRRVRFAGAVPEAEVAQLLGAADVMLLPCRAEGLANAWVEALACGTPVVTTDIPSATEAVPPDAGRLVPRDAGAIAAAVREMIDSPPPPDVLARAAAKFSWERNADALRDHLAALAKLRRAA